MPLNNDLAALNQLLTNALPYFAADDYDSFAGAKRAVEEFRAARGIEAPLSFQALPETQFEPGRRMRWHAAWWIKESCV
ncbi:hypothetical protein ABPG75_001139 [Micractinium tetrahymenae]